MPAYKNCTIVTPDLKKKLFGIHATGPFGMAEAGHILDMGASKKYSSLGQCRRASKEESNRGSGFGPVRFRRMNAQIRRISQGYPKDRKNGIGDSPRKKSKV